MERSEMGSMVLLDLAGGVALLLWGLHMVLTGVLRAFGPDLRRFISKALRNRFTAFGAGLGLTALLQSSTATGLMTASLAADGTVDLVLALAIMLGANVGTTLIVQLLSFNVSAIAPVLFVIGLVTFRVSGGSGLVKAIGRIAIGLGLMLLALHILLDTLAPAEEAPAVRALLSSVTTDPVFCIVIAAGLTWAAHSSVAVVLLVMSLAYSQFVTTEAALALVLGANLGSAINPFDGDLWRHFLDRLADFIGRIGQTVRVDVDANAAGGTLHVFTRFQSADALFEITAAARTLELDNVGIGFWHRALSFCNAGAWHHAGTAERSHSQDLFFSHMAKSAACRLREGFSDFPRCRLFRCPGEAGRHLIYELSAYFRST
jgi:Na/Pi-cotransporter